jgi:hypothetical protein
MTSMTRWATATVTLASALGLVACGQDATSTREKAATKATPAQALVEIGATKQALDRGLAAVRAGDPDQAREILSEAYVEHFEEVEGPLEDVDHELKEKLEVTLSTGIRDQVEAGAPVAQVERLVLAAQADLDAAAAKLR